MGAERRLRKNEGLEQQPAPITVHPGVVPGCVVVGPLPVHSVAQGQEHFLIDSAVFEHLLCTRQRLPPPTSCFSYLNSTFPSGLCSPLPLEFCTYCPFACSTLPGPLLLCPNNSVTCVLTSLSSPPASLCQPPNSP